MHVSNTQPDQYTWVLECSGKLNFQARQIYRQAVSQAAEASPRHVIVDLTGVSYIDGAGLGLLVLTHKQLADLGIRLSLTVIQVSVKQVLELTNLHTLFPIYASVATASREFTVTMPLDEGTVEE